MEQETTNGVKGLSVPTAIILAGIIVALAIIFTGGIGGNGTPTGQNTGTPTGTTLDDEDKLAIAKMRTDDHVFGNRNAEVYIVEFSDTECPFCKQFHTTLHQIVNDYDGQVAWVYRHFPIVQLHSKAPREAEALECAGELGGNDGFWKYTDRLYEITPSNNGLAETELPKIAEFAGLNRATFETCLASGKYTEKVKKDMEDAIALGGRGTPHSVIVANGTVTPIFGAQPIATLKSTIDTILKK